ncbi:MAG: hypothetical protein IKN11_09045, partial [Bacteroidales bacterium]|nr:hypothetical protein [Bacteroidales bacterium]
TQSESRESLLALPSPSNVMEHKEMLIWHKQTLKSEKGYKSRSNDRFGFNTKLCTTAEKKQPLLSLVSP